MRRLLGSMMFAGAVLTAACQSKPDQGVDVGGEWQSGATVYQITTSGTKITGKFDMVSPAAQALGFKKGDVSFEATRNGNFLLGEQVIRYPAENPCHKPAGRRVPFMGIVGRDGRGIVIDWYNISVNTQTCQDVGRTVETTLLERRAGQR